MKSKSLEYIREELLTTIASFFFKFIAFPLSLMAHWPAHGVGSGIWTIFASCLQISDTSPPIGAKLYVQSAAIDTTLSRKSCITISDIPTPGLTLLALMLGRSIPVEMHNSLLRSKLQSVQWMPPSNL